MEKLINYIESNSITTTFVSDALGKHGEIPNCKRIINKKDEIICGKIYPIFVANGSNYSLHDQIRFVPENSICVVFTHNIDKIAVLGSLVSDFLFKKRKIKALVIHGLIRDSYEILQANYPIWCYGFCPIGCSNKIAPPFPYEKQKLIESTYLNSIGICDTTGVVAIPKYLSCNPELIINKMEKIRIKELIWDHCINELGWDTYETIAKESYLKEKSKRLKWDNKLDNLLSSYANE